MRKVTNSTAHVGEWIGKNWRLEQWVADESLPRQTPSECPSVCKCRGGHAATYAVHSPLLRRYPLQIAGLPAPGRGLHCELPHGAWMTGANCCQLTTERTSKALPAFRELILGRWILAGCVAWRCNRRRRIGFAEVRACRLPMRRGEYSASERVLARSPISRLDACSRLQLQNASRHSNPGCRCGRRSPDRVNNKRLSGDNCTVVRSK
jgi:hypothetical protein